MKWQTETASPMESAGPNVLSSRLESVAARTVITRMNVKTPSMAKPWYFVTPSPSETLPRAPRFLAGETA